jgi:hypothetical protein
MTTTSGRDVNVTAHAPGKPRGTHGAMAARLETSAADLPASRPDVGWGQTTSEGGGHLPPPTPGPSVGIGPKTLRRAPQGGLRPDA